MSITSDLRSYADNAVNQGKQALDAGVANLSDIADKAAGTAQDLRSSAEKAVNLDALTSAVEPYFAQLKEYGSIVTDKVEVLVSGVRSDKRVAKIVDSAEPVVDAVVDLVQQHVVKPVRSLTGTQTRKPAVTKPAASTSSATSSAVSSAAPSASATATRPARKAAATKPAAKPATKTARPASRPAARKAPAKSSPDA